MYWVVLRHECTVVLAVRLQILRQHTLLMRRLHGLVRVRELPNIVEPRLQRHELADILEELGEPWRGLGLSVPVLGIRVEAV